MTAKLNTQTAFDDPDAFYNRLIEAHEGLDDDKGNLLNAKLVLLLANHIGDMAVIEQAIAAARKDSTQ